MILEGIVTTVGAGDRLNVAPMGPLVEDEPGAGFESLVLRPFKTSRTYANLKKNPEGVLHVTDDVLLLARATIGNPDPPTQPARVVRGRRLVDCCRFFEFRIERSDDSSDRTTLVARVLHQEHVRDFFGFNRAKHAVVEAAILASRVLLLSREELLGQFDRLRVLVEKTGGPSEQQAFLLLEDHVRTLIAQRKRDDGIGTPPARHGQ